MVPAPATRSSSLTVSSERLYPKVLGDAALPKKSSAMPPDVRKAFGLPVSRHFDLGLRPVLLGRSPEIINDRTGSAERFRTSSGIAALDESLFGQSQVTLNTLY